MGNDRVANPPSRIARIVRWMTFRAKSRSILPILPAFPASDFVLPVLPNQLLLIGLAMSARKRWWLFASLFAIGTAMGGAMVALGIQSLGLDKALFGAGAEAASELQDIFQALQRHGLWLLAGVALLPWTPRLTVVACALAGFAPLQIGGLLLAARLVPSGGLALVGANLPRLASRIGWLRRWAEGKGLTS